VKCPARRPRDREASMKPETRFALTVAAVVLLLAALALLA
jgi:hypothetical protein